MPVILVTTHNDVDDVKVAMSTGVAAYVVKPFEASTIIEKVKAILYPDGLAPPF